MTIRIACVLVLLSLAALFALILDTRGATAIAFVFVGFPLLGLGIFLYLASERRSIGRALARTMTDDSQSDGAEPGDAGPSGRPTGRAERVE
ncbi:MAG: hypothetical protein ACX98W_19190 [bacterium]